MSSSRTSSEKHATSPRLFVIMGVAGSGKSLIGAGVAERLAATYIDGDDFHPSANVEKMSRGVPLSDADRWPWLDVVGQRLSEGKGIRLVGCSALKRSYRERIAAEAGKAVHFLYLEGSRELITSRMAARTGHFMPTSLLESQFETLEVPGSDENAAAIDISGSPDQVVDAICRYIRNLQPA